MADSLGMHSAGTSLFVGGYGLADPTVAVQANIVALGYTYLAELVDADGLSVAPSVTRLTHLRSDNKGQEKVPGFKDGGQLRCRFNYQVALFAQLLAFVPGGASAPETAAQAWGRKKWVLVLPDTGAWVFKGFLAGNPITVPEDDRVTIEATIEVTGVPAFLDLL